MNRFSGYFQRFKGAIELDFCVGVCRSESWDIETEGKVPYITKANRLLYLEGSLFLWAFRVSYTLWEIK